VVFIKTHIILFIALVVAFAIIFIIWRIKKKRSRDGYIKRFIPNNNFENRAGYISYQNEVPKKTSRFSESLDGLGVIGDILKSILGLFKSVGEVFEGFGGGGSGGIW
jgi:hypothetical protein